VNAHVCRKPRRERVPTHSRGRVHRSHDLDLVVNVHEFEVLVVETPVRD
jgi:hypothetical protein